MLSREAFLSTAPAETRERPRTLASPAKRPAPNNSRRLQGAVIRVSSLFVRGIEIAEATDLLAKPATEKCALPRARSEVRGGIQAQPLAATTIVFALAQMVGSRITRKFFLRDRHCSWPWSGLWLYTSTHHAVAKGLGRLGSVYNPRTRIYGQFTPLVYCFAGRTFAFGSFTGGVERSQSAICFFMAAARSGCWEARLVISRGSAWRSKSIGSFGSCTYL